MLADIRLAVADLVQDGTGAVDTDRIDRAIGIAVVRLSTDVPRDDGYRVTATEDTVPAAMQEPLSCYAAAAILDGLAAAACGNTGSTITADAINRNNQAADYAARARAYRKRYSELLGLGSPEAAAASGASVPWPGRPRINPWRPVW